MGGSPVCPATEAGHPKATFFRAANRLHDRNRHERLGDIQDVLTEGHKIANIVRHGDGDTSADLRQIAPRLWQSDPGAYVDINPDPSPDSTLLIVTDDYLRDYTRAGLRFCGRADRLPGAINDPPF